MSATDAGPSMVDWDFAVRLGTRLAGDGPQVSRAEADEAVAELRADADRSTALVRSFTGLDANEGTAPVLVVDRGGWVQANADAFAHVITPLTGSLTEKRPPSPLAASIGSRITGAEVGGLLGFLASKVLGQFDPFHEPQGRLLLVAPNIVQVERDLDVDPTDFRLWVCLHEETHRVQFTAVPWMRDHLFSEVEAISATVGPAGIEEMVRRLADGARTGLRNGSLLDLMSSPEQKQIVDRITGMMSLLEGHADVVMDGVGPSVIPSVARIRSRFTERRKGAGSLDRLIRRLLGFEAKMAQYRDGANFVRGVVDRVGMEHFNAVWERAENLPSKAELADPQAWMRRVL